MDVKEYFKCDFALKDLSKVEVRLLYNPVRSVRPK